MAQHILIVAGESETAGRLRRALALEGYDVVVVADGHSALSLVEGSLPDLLVLDAAAPVVDGLEVTRRIRAAGIDIPIIMLCSHNGDIDPVTAFDCGIDDFLADAAATAELVARMRVQFRHREDSHCGDILHIGALRLDLLSREVFVGEKPVELTAREFDVLALFMRHPHHVLKRSFVYEQVWGYDFGALSNLIEVHVSSLRHKLADAGAPELIHTVRSIGYMLAENHHGRAPIASANP